MTNEPQPPTYDGAHTNKELYVSLRDYFESRIRDIERSAATASHNSEIALDKASTATEYRLAVMNEFRNAMSDQSAKFVTRTEYISERDGNRRAVEILRDATIAETKAVRIGAADANENLRIALQSEIKGLQKTVYTLVGALAAIQAIVTLLANNIF